MTFNFSDLALVVQEDPIDEFVMDQELLDRILIHFAEKTDADISARMLGGVRLSVDNDMPKNTIALVGPGEPRRRIYGVICDVSS